MALHPSACQLLCASEPLVQIPPGHEVCRPPWLEMPTSRPSLWRDGIPHVAVPRCPQSPGWCPFPGYCDLRCSNRGSAAVPSPEPCRILRLYPLRFPVGNRGGQRPAAAWTASKSTADFLSRGRREVRCAHGFEDCGSEHHRQCSQGLQNSQQCTESRARGQETSAGARSRESWASTGLSLPGSPRSFCRSGVSSKRPSPVRSWPPPALGRPVKRWGKDLWPPWPLPVPCGSVINTAVGSQQRSKATLGSLTKGTACTWGAQRVCLECPAWSLVPRGPGRHRCSQRSQ